VIPILSEPALHMFRNAEDAPLDWSPGKVFEVHNDAIVQIRPARQWYEPIEDEL
jgi:hypothetical protein